MNRAGGLIHATAIVHPGARLAEDVEIGAYTLVGEHVEIGPGTRVGAHTMITGHTRIGRNNRIYQFVSLGEAPQDRKYAGEPTQLEIGDGNTIREFCTFNRGTAQDVGITRLGDDNWIMAYVHLAHDCQVGSHTIFANNAQIAGHVHVGDYAVLGAFTAVHQFCQIGAHCITAMGSIVLQDVPPYVMAAGNTAEPRGVNTEGLKRRGFDSDDIARIKRAFKTLYRSELSLEQAKQALSAQLPGAPELGVLLAFLGNSKRGIIR